MFCMKLRGREPLHSSRLNVVGSEGSRSRGLLVGVPKCCSQAIICDIVCIKIFTGSEYDAASVGLASNGHHETSLGVGGVSSVHLTRSSSTTDTKSHADAVQLAHRIRGKPTSCPCFRACSPVYVVIGMFLQQGVDDGKVSNHSLAGGKSV